MKDCLSPPLPEIAQSAHLLLNAEAAHVAKRHAEAGQLIGEADCPKVRDWVNSVMGKFNPLVHAFYPQVTPAPHLAITDRPRPRMPVASVRREVIERDGYHCRFCGMPVISAKRRKAIAQIYPDQLRWGKSNAERHAAFWCMWLQFDHVLPNGRGGASSPDNVVVACAPCNFGRNNLTLEEAGLSDPRQRPKSSRWLSLESWNDLADFE